MRLAFEKDLQQFDCNRVRLAWEGLVSKQQATLESLRVPAMYTSESSLERDVSLSWFIAQISHLRYIAAATDSHSSGGYYLYGSNLIMIYWYHN